MDGRASTMGDSMTATADDTWLELADAPQIDGLRFRRPRGDDAEYEAIAEMIVAANRLDEILWVPTAQNLRDEIESSAGVDPRADIVVAEIDGRVVGNSIVDRVMRDGVATYEMSGFVHPEVRRRGLGGTLLRENLRRATERAAVEPAGQAAVARVHAEETETGHRVLLESHGFEAVRWFFLMRHSTGGEIPDAPLPGGLELRPVTPDEHRAIFDAEREAFRDHWAAREWTEEDFRLTFARDELDTDLWVVAWDGDEVAAVVENWIWAAENTELGVARGWLERISVRRSWRRRGLGRAITAESLRRLAAAGMTEAILGVDADSPTGALGLYEGLGFEVYQRSQVYRRPLGG
jgi:mycothiol synthase